MRRVTQHRASCEWGKYVTSDDALKIKELIKKTLNNNLTLIQFFGACINEEDNWNYNQMALQVDDAVDLLLLKYKNKTVYTKHKIERCWTLPKTSWDWRQTIHSSI